MEQCAQWNPPWIPGVEMKEYSILDVKRRCRAASPARAACIECTEIDKAILGNKVYISTPNMAEFKVGMDRVDWLSRDLCDIQGDI